jgi:hypothetical protein
MKVRINLKSDPISLTILSANVYDHKKMDEVGHDGIVEAGIEKAAEQLSIDGATPAPRPQGSAGQVSEEFEKELTHLINRYSIENMADMPDFLLARMLCAMIESMGPTVKATLDWHGCSSVCHPSPNSI